MNAEWTQMVDAEMQIKDALRDLDPKISYAVSSRWPRRGDTGNLITVTEITNTQTAVAVVDNLAYQIDLWSLEADVIVTLAPLVNAALCGMGFRRDYASPAEPYQDGNFYRRTFRFGRKVDKRTMRLID